MCCTLQNDASDVPYILDFLLLFISFSIKKEVYMHGLDSLKQYWPLLVPIAIIQVGLMVAALIHIFTHKTYKVGNRVLWVILSIVINTIGPILYFVIGKGDE